MKKRIFTIALALLLVLLMAIPALADEPNRATQLTYTVTSSYTVTIPATTIDLASQTLTTTISVDAAGKINSNQKITVTAVSAHPGTDPANFQIQNTEGNALTYTVKKGDESTGSAILSGAVAAEFSADQVNSGASQALAFNLTGTPQFAGIYTDTITFTVTCGAA